MLNEKDLKILELNNQLNSLKAYVANELSHLKAINEQLESVVLTLIRNTRLSPEEFVQGLLETGKNLAYKEQILNIINNKHE